MVSDRAILAGDAAGFVDPLTGEGIYYAMKSGLLAASACKRGIEENDLTQPFLKRYYSDVCEEKFGKDLRIALELAYRIHHNLNAFFDFLRDHPVSSWVDFARGDISYRGLRKKILSYFLAGLIKEKIRDLSHVKY